MRSIRVYSALPVMEGATLTLDDEAAHHVTTILRLRQGDALRVFHNGVEAEAVIEQSGKHAVTVSIASCRIVDRESPLAITLAQGISRGERMDYTIQKAVELGVTRIAPIITDRTTVKLDETRAEKRLEHWRRILINACEQSGRNQLPVLLPIVSLDTWLGEPPEGSALLLRGDARQSITHIAHCRNVTLLIGPEGGMSAAEVDAAEDAGYLAVRMGPRILRTETAALAAIAALQAMHGDWQ